MQQFSLQLSPELLFHAELLATLLKFVAKNELSSQIDPTQLRISFF